MVIKFNMQHDEAAGLQNVETQHNLFIVFMEKYRKLSKNYPFAASYLVLCCIHLSSSFNFRAFCAGSKDMNTRVYGAQKFSNLVVYSLGGHINQVVGAYFERDSLDVSSYGS